MDMLWSRPALYLIRAVLLFKLLFSPQLTLNQPQFSIEPQQLYQAPNPSRADYAVEAAYSLMHDKLDYMPITSPQLPSFFFSNILGPSNLPTGAWPAASPIFITTMAPTFPNMG
ncbi:hypothetical protein F4776DRAFT_610333 [Hypoxylon sp. NC0597]|nr:hypothetical protein F4776DRAFT_610333 [Hypoxylon sp. NC0597]